MYTTHYRNMQVTALTSASHAETCGYWYTVTCGASAHTAFATKSGLRRWLEERGLKLPRGLPSARGEFTTMPVIGEYYSMSHGMRIEGDGPFVMVEDEEWRALKPLIITAGLSNGRYTLFLITESDGVRTVHHLNPNVKTRLEATDHATMRFLLS